MKGLCLCLFLPFAALVWMDVATAEIRKLIPVCSNSCRDPGKNPSTYCHCDSKCSLIYNDCCLDAPYRAVRAALTKRVSQDCFFVHGENKHFLMVNSCKETWSGQDQIRAKCSERNFVSGDTEDIWGAIPVTNPEEEVTYKNYYCSLCNDENPEDLIEWQVKALCSDKCVTQNDVLYNLTFAQDKQQWGVWKWTLYANWKFFQCYLLFQKPARIPSGGIRQCASGMVSTCPASWKNMAIRRQCKSYIDPVKWPTGPIYKNMDCAICHNQTRENYQCLYDITGNSNAVALNLAFSVDMNALGQV